MACINSQKNTVAEVFAVCATCDGVEEATWHCDDCLKNICARCAVTHETRSGENLASGTDRHRADPGVCSYDMEIELCPLDGQKKSFFCVACQARVCPECELTNKHHSDPSHSIVTLNRHMGHEKEKLLDKLDDVTTKIETISFLPKDIKSVATWIELKWLERKELMRQEFISLLETITVQQDKLMADMEKAVKDSLEQLERLHETHEALLSSTCQLSDDCISAVQNLSRQQFMESYPQYLDSIQAVVRAVDRMTCAEDCAPAFLQVPFSLHSEKVRLHHSLQLSAYDWQHMKAREYKRFVGRQRLSEELAVSSLLDTPSDQDLPPSSTLRYHVDIYRGSGYSKHKSSLWSGASLRSCDTVVNGQDGLQLVPGALYAVKVTPVITVTTHKGHQTLPAKVVTIVMVTESGTDYGQTAAVVKKELLAFENSIRHLDTGCHNAGIEVNNSNNNNNDVTGVAAGQLHNPFHGTVHPNTGQQGLAYSCDIGCTEADQGFSPVKAQDGSGLFQCQARYLKWGKCCFEEARLIEAASMVTHLPSQDLQIPPAT